MIPSNNTTAVAGTQLAIEDSLGRRLVMRQLTALDKLRLLKAAGPELAQNPPWLGMAILAASVSSIDDVPVPPPTTEQQIEALVGRLGEAGLEAVSGAFEQFAEPSLRDVAPTAGNLPGTPT